MQVHLVDTKKYVKGVDEDQLLFEILERDDNGSIDVLVLLGYEFCQKKFLAELKNIDIRARCIFSNQLTLFTTHPSIIDFFLGLQSIKEYEFWLDSFQPNYVSIDSKIVQLFECLKSDVRNGRYDRQIFLLSRLSNLFQNSIEMSVPIYYFEKQYRVFHGLLQNIFINGDIANLKKLGRSWNDGADVVRLEEFNTIFKMCSDADLYLNRRSPTISSYLKKIAGVYSTAHSSAFDGNGLPHSSQASTSFLWLAAFLFLYAEGRLHEKQNMLALLATFRVLELVSYSILLSYSLIEFRRIRSNRVLAFLRTDEQIKGFGPAWHKLKFDVLKTGNLCKTNRIQAIDEFIHIRNGLLLIHGTRFVNTQLAKKYICEVWGFIEDIESNLNKKNLKFFDFTNKYNYFKSTHCYDVAKLAIDSVAEVLDIDGLSLQL